MLSECEQALWRLVRPGGQLAVTTWGPSFAEPMNSRFWSAVREVKPGLVNGYIPWDRISEPDALRSMLSGAGVSAQEVVLENTTQTLSSPEDWWHMVLATGYRATIDQLDLEGGEHVRRDNFEFIRETDVTSVELNVIYAIATKG